MGKGRSVRIAAVLGFLAYALLSCLFLIWIAMYIFVLGLGISMLSWVYDLYIISFFALEGGGLIFLALWSLALARPEWLSAHPRTVALVSLIIWILYTGSTTTIFTVHPNISFTISLIFYTLIFLFALSFTFLQARSDRRAILLFTGLLLFYLTHASLGFVTIYPIRVHHITMIGLWFVLAWYFETREKPIG